MVDTNKDKFIPKLKLEKFSIGSFDSFLEESKEIIREKLNIRKFAPTDDVDEFLKKLPYTYRGSIVRNDNNEYIGYIGIYSIDFSNNLVSIILQTKIRIREKEINEIINAYKAFLYNDLFIESIKEIYILNENESSIKQSFCYEDNTKIKSDYFEARYNRYRFKTI